MRFEVSKKTEDGLTVETWAFCLLDNMLVLDDYKKVIRPTPRHKNGNVVAHYNRLFVRVSTIEEADVPWSSELAGEALLHYMATIRVGRWKADFGR